MDYKNRLERWQGLWDSGVYKNWHLTDKNPDLWKFLHLLCAEDQDKKAGIFLIPMCGKCVDMKCLYEVGFTVLGIDFCESTVQEFFTESALPYEILEASKDFKVYSTTDGQLKIACGDLLAATRDLFAGNKVSMVWDRGAFGSIAKELRKDYVRVIKELLSGGDVKYFLDCWEFDDWYKSTPPNNCPANMIRELFGDGFSIEELQRIENKNRAAGLGSQTAHKVFYLMTSKCLVGVK